MLNFKHNKTAVLGVWFGKNYGSALTYFALSSVLIQFNCDVTLIDKINNGDIESEENNHSRIFLKKYFRIMTPKNEDDYASLNLIFDNFVIGSDQVWNRGISRNFGYRFYLDFVNDAKTKISIASSFGHAVDFATDEEKLIINNYLRRFNLVTVREKEGVDICKYNYNINAIQILDPVFLVKKKRYELMTSKIPSLDDYILAYILDVSDEKLFFIKLLSSLLNMKVVFILDGFANSYESDSQRIKNNFGDNFLLSKSSISVEEWLSFFKNSYFVATDSFHGSCFSIIFNKQFICFKNKKRGISRVENLARIFNLSDKFIEDKNLYDFAYQTNSIKECFRLIDYKQISLKISYLRSYYIKFLKIKFKEFGLCAT